MDDIAAFGLLDDDEIVLDEAALRLAALDQPGVVLDPYLDLLEAATDRLGEAGEAARTAGEQATALADVFAGEFGFAGDRDTYDDPANADLIRVIDRRLGLPVSLAILHVAAARRLGWQADVLNTPGHVLVRIGPALEPLLTDPFNRGAIVSPMQLSALLSAMLGPGATPLPEHLSPLPNRSVLVRLLMNQATRAERAGDTARALTLYERITAVAPSNAHGWWERARLELAGGDPARARSSLSAMLEVSRDPATREQIFAALDALSGAGR